MRRGAATPSPFLPPRRKRCCQGASRRPVPYHQVFAFRGYLPTPPLLHLELLPSPETPSAPCPRHAPPSLAAPQRCRRRLDSLPAAAVPAAGVWLCTDAAPERFPCFFQQNTAELANLASHKAIHPASAPIEHEELQQRAGEPRPEHYTQQSEAQGRPPTVLVVPPPPNGHRPAAPPCCWLHRRVALRPLSNSKCHPLASQIGKRFGQLSGATVGALEGRASRTTGARQRRRRRAPQSDTSKARPSARP